MLRLAVYALMAATSLCFVEGCMFGCDANGIDEKPVALKAQSLEAHATCGEADTFHLRAVDAKGNAITFDVSGAEEGQFIALSPQASPTDSSDRIAEASGTANARMALHTVTGADATDATDITSAVVQIKSLPAGGAPFTIEVRLGFADGGTLDEEYRAAVTPDATCETN